MTILMDRFLRKPVWNAEGGSGGGEAPAPEAAAAESVLFPSEGDSSAGSVEENTTDGEETSTDGAGEWKEYEPDPNKSDDENAAAKAEHDKTKPADDKDDPANKVPEDGKYDLKMPDGVELDAELASALGPDFKELNLTNAQAQKLVDKYISVQTERTQKQAEGFSATVTKWADDAKKDKEIGGTHWDGTVTHARRAIDTLGNPALKEYLEVTGGGNHPEVIRFMAKVGTMIREDNPASGGAEGAGKPAEAAYTLFPTDAPKGK